MDGRRAEAGRPLPDYVQQECDAYLRCGRLEEGFLRVRCEQCTQELLPDRVGMVSGLFFGLLFGVSGIGAAAQRRSASWRTIAASISAIGSAPSCRRSGC